MNECPHFGEWFGGCKFEPRYDEVPNCSGNLEMQRSSVAAIKAVMVRTVYVRDVCVRCGKTIERAS